MPFILHVTTNTRSSTSIIGDMGLEWKIYKQPNVLFMP